MPSLNNVISTKNCIFQSQVGPCDSGKTYSIYKWLKVETFQPKFDKTHCFYQYPQPLYDAMQKENDNLEFVQCVHFEIIKPLKNNGTKYLLSFDDSYAEICNSTEFVDIATASRQRGFGTMYIKRNLFQQRKIERDVELQNTHIVLLKSFRYVHQVAILSVQMGLGSTLVDWYRDATSVPFGQLLIGLSPRTDDRLRYFTISVDIPSNIYIHENLKHLKFSDGGRTKFLYSPSIPALFPRMQNSVSKNLSKIIYPICQRVHRQTAPRKFVSSKKKLRPIVMRRNSRIVFKKNNLEATRKSTFVAKRIIAN